MSIQAVQEGQIRGNDFLLGNAFVSSRLGGETTEGRSTYQDALPSIAWLQVTPPLLPSVLAQAPTSTAIDPAVSALEATFQTKIKSQSVSVTVSVPQDRRPSVQDFTAKITDPKQYPLTGTYLGTAVLEECSLRRQVGDYVVMYQRTGGMWPVKGRGYIIALRVVPGETNPDKVTIEWHGVKEAALSSDDKAYVKKHDTVYPPYIYGYWVYDKGSGKITYTAEVDPGGNIPATIQPEGAALAFPKELIRVNGWGNPD